MNESPLVCCLCGASAEGDELPLAWSTSSAGTADPSRVVFCERCTRENVRSMEAKLDPAWW